MYLEASFGAVYEPTFEQVEAALLEMDNAAKAWVLFTHDPADVDERFLIASGGNQDRILVSYVDTTNDVSMNLLGDLPEDAPDIGMLAGNQRAEYPAKYAVLKQVAVEAFRHYFYYKTLLKKLNWEER